MCCHQDSTITAPPKWQHPHYTTVFCCCLSDTRFGLNILDKCARLSYELHAYKHRNICFIHVVSTSNLDFVFCANSNFCWKYWIFQHCCVPLHIRTHTPTHTYWHCTHVIKWLFNEWFKVNGCAACMAAYFTWCIWHMFQNRVCSSI